MALPGARQLTVELIPHCTSVVRDGWIGSHDVRPLAELGVRQAKALVAAIGGERLWHAPAASRRPRRLVHAAVRIRRPRDHRA
jgi:broad specificity phosphatase PhoE